MIFRLITNGWVAALFLLTNGFLQADVKMPAIFGNHMVLQQDTKIPVWGWADAGEAVTVTFGDQTAKTTADAKGNWRVDLDPVKTAATPLTLTVTGKNSLKFDDVLVGDVWICSGQSNMEVAVSYNYTSTNDIPQANDPGLRIFFVPKKVALDPENDVVGEWKVCSSAVVPTFSAVGYYFGRELRHELNRPIGLIGAYWGGMPAQSFVSLSGLQKYPPFIHYIEVYRKDVADYPKARQDYPAALAAFQARQKWWTATIRPRYQPVVLKWRAALKQAEANHQPPPPEPMPPVPWPNRPSMPEGPPTTPSVLFNGMIAPLIPYAIKGVIWYQGESNTDNGIEYQTLFPRMISDWREKWHQGNFPFLYVQLANYITVMLPGLTSLPPPGGWAAVREAQLKTLALPNTGMAVIIDIGDPHNVHPKDKIDVARRLALAARHVAYGQDIVYSGPIYDSMKIKGKTIRLSFKDTGSGLQISAPPWNALGLPPITPTELTGFAIAGADQHWVWAKARIDGNTVVVSSDQVAAPVAVRYGWENNPSCDLYNKEGLPASPFRTDDWADITPPPDMPSSSPAPSPKP